MIRLSRLTALEILPQIEIKDINLTKLHLYKFENANRIQYQFVQDDSQAINSREFAYSPYIQNISLNPTPAFYPAERISPTFHADSDLQVVLNDVSLPLMQFQTVNLYFSQGFSYNTQNRGTLIRAYIKLNNNREVTLASIWDQPASSQLTASVQKLFESQIFNTKLSFQIPDIDFILNSTAAEIVALKQLIFGSERPDKIYFEYSSLIDSNIDTITVGGFEYVQLNASNFNTNSIDIGFQKATNLFAKLSVENRFIRSELRNELYDVETYLNKFKESEQTYKITHQFTTSYYDATSQLIGSKSVSMTNDTDIFDAVEYVPIVSENTDHFETSVDIVILNEQTGMRMTKSASIIVADGVDKFKLSYGAVVLNLSQDKVYNKINQQINKIVHKSDVPDIVQITKPIFIQSETEADTITLLPATFTVKVNLNIDLENVSKTYIRIDSVTVPNVANDLSTFTIPAKAYYTESETFFVLNQFQEVITSGTLKRK